MTNYIFVTNRLICSSPRVLSARTGYLAAALSFVRTLSSHSWQETLSAALRFSLAALGAVGNPPSGLPHISWRAAKLSPSLAPASRRDGALRSPLWVDRFIRGLASLGVIRLDTLGMAVALYERYGTLNYVSVT